MWTNVWMDKIIVQQMHYVKILNQVIIAHVMMVMMVMVSLVLVIIFSFPLLLLLLKEFNIHNNKSKMWMNVKREMIIVIPKQHVQIILEAIVVNVMMDILEMASIAMVFLFFSFFSFLSFFFLSFFSNRSFENKIIN